MLSAMNWLWCDSIVCRWAQYHEMLSVSLFSSAWVRWLRLWWSKSFLWPHNGSTKSIQIIRWILFIVRCGSLEGCIAYNQCFDRKSRAIMSIPISFWCASATVILLL